MDSGFHGGKSRMHERTTEEDNDEWGDLEGSYQKQKDSNPNTRTLSPRNHIIYQEPAAP